MPREPIDVLVVGAGFAGLVTAERLCAGAGLKVVDRRGAMKGPEALSRGTAEQLYLCLRLGLIAAFALHIHSAYSLTRLNRQARPVRYQSPRDYVAANWAARTMRWSGVIVGLFLIWHLALHGQQPPIMLQ